MPNSGSPLLCFGCWGWVSRFEVAIVFIALRCSSLNQSPPPQVRSSSAAERFSGKRLAGRRYDRDLPVGLQPRFDLVAVGVSPAVEPSVSPGGLGLKTGKSINFARHPGGETPPSMAGGTPTATAQKTANSSCKWYLLCYITRSVSLAREAVSF